MSLRRPKPPIKGSSAPEEEEEVMKLNSNGIYQINLPENL